MLSRFILVHKITGRILPCRQGVYISAASASKARSQFTRPENRQYFAIVELTEEIMLKLLADQEGTTK